MPKRIRLHPYLTEHELHERYRQTPDPVERSRWHFLWLLTRGLTATAVARVTGYSAYWIGQIAHRYNATGPEGVRDQRRRAPVRRDLLSDEQQTALRVALAALDLERRELHVTSVLKEFKSNRYLGSPKTPRSRRTIPLTQLAVDLLRHHKVAQAEERLKNGSSWNSEHLVFCTSTGTAFAASNWHREYYRPLIRKAGLPYIRPHDIRHTAATLLLLDGVPAIVVSRMLGHTNVAFTLQTYGHVLAEMREMARDAMERRFGGSLPTSFGESTSF
jgi:integrase